MDPHVHRTRRALLQRGAALGAVAAAGAVLGSCSSTQPGPPPAPTPDEDTTTPPTRSRTLLAYFSRPGENYYYGGRRDLEVGNTEVLAEMIAELVDCDTYRIEAADAYPDGYDATVARNSGEQDANARPEIATLLSSIEDYDTILIGSPIWGSRTPMIMTTFVEGFDFAAKTVHPFVTFAVSGLGRAEQDYVAGCPGADLRPGLAVQGEEVPDRRSDVEDWLRAAGLTA